MKKILLTMCAVIAALSMQAADIFIGPKHVSWSDGGVQIQAASFAEAQPGQKIVVTFSEASDGIEFKVMNEHFDHLAGSREAAWIKGDGAFEQYLTDKAVEDLKTYGLEIIGGNFTCTKVELLEGRALQKGISVWAGYFWIDSWNTLELYADGYNYVDFSKIEAVRFYTEANRSDIVINVRDSWDESGLITTAESMTAGEGYLELPLTDELRTRLSKAGHWMVQYDPNGGSDFNATDIVLVEKAEEPVIEDEPLWSGDQHISWSEGGLQLSADKFAEAQAGNLLKVHFTGASDGIEFKVMNEHFDHLSGSREAAYITGEGAFEQYLTDKAVEDLKTYGLEIIGGNFTCTKVELLEGKELKKGVTVWTGFFWAEDWKTLELYADGYNYVDFSNVEALRIYTEAGRSDIVINIMESWEQGGLIAAIGDMSAGEGYMELAMTEELRTRLSKAGHWMVQFNQESGAPFNVTDIVLVMDNTTTAIDHAAEGQKAVKAIENGRIVIIKDGVRYNTLGVQF